MIKTIKPLHVEQVRLEDLRPGMITVDGVIVSVSLFYYYTPLGPVHVDRLDQTVPVFAKLESADMLGPICDAMIEAGRRMPT